MAGRTPPIATGKQRLMERLRAKAASELEPTPPPAELSLAIVGAGSTIRGARASRRAFASRVLLWEPPEVSD